MHDEIVTAMQFQDYILIFTRRGDIYRCHVTEFDGKFQFSLIYRMFPPA